jgi:glycosyltransferase involved in cell wall biosynthesis
MKTPGHSRCQDLRLLILEDFCFVANGGIETVRISFISEFSRVCPVVWIMPQGRISNTIKKLPSGNGIVFESLFPRKFSISWYVIVLSRLLSKLEHQLSFVSISPKLASLSKQILLESIITKYNITHVLNLGIFDEPLLALSVPAYGIVYDINHSPRTRSGRLLNLAHWLQKAAGIFTISEYSRDDIVKSLRPGSCTIYSIPIAVSPPPMSASEGRRLQEQKEPTFFYPASFNPHKNHGLILRALALVHELGYSFKVIFTGYNTHLLSGSQFLEDSQLEDARLFLANSSPDFRSCIQAYGTVDESHLEELFEHATCVLLPTSYEGFGLPLTEASLRGVPVICSDIPPFHEQVRLYKLKTGVIFVQDPSPHAWSVAIIKLLADLPTLSPLLQENKEAWRRWTWADVVNGYISILSPGYSKILTTKA